MITAKMSDGFSIELEEDALDARALEDLAKMEKDGTRLFSLLDRALGEENKAKLYQHLETENGKVPLEALCLALNELLTSFQAGKNSASSPN